MIAIRLGDAWRKAQNRALKMLPDGVLDGILEKRYQAILGPGNKAKEIAPGSPAGAVADPPQ